MVDRYRYPSHCFVTCVTLGAESHNIQKKTSRVPNTSIHSISFSAWPVIPMLGRERRMNEVEPLHFYKHHYNLTKILQDQHIHSNDLIYQSRLRTHQASPRPEQRKAINFGHSIAHFRKNYTVIVSLERTKMTTTTTRNREARKLWAVPLVNLTLAIGLLAYHVRAEVEVDGATCDLSAWRRIISGPNFWTSMDKVVFCVLIMFAMEILNFLVKKSGGWMNSKQIPVRGKHLDELSPTDKLFIGISKAQTGPFVYFLLRYCFHESNILWNLNEITLRTVFLPLPAVFIIFDFFYTIMHWALHIKAVYAFVHKHHHHQKAPR